MDSFKPLPAPHGAVKVKVETCLEQIRMIYIGFPDDLVRCGAAEAASATFTPWAQNQGTDTRGHDWHTQRATNGRVRLELRINTIAAARTLPGFAEKFIPDEIMRLHENPASLIVTDYVYDGSFEEALGTRAALIAEGWCTEDTFKKRDIYNYNGGVRELIDGFFICRRRKVVQLTPEESAKELCGFVGHMCKMIKDYARKEAKTYAGLTAESLSAIEGHAIAIDTLFRNGVARRRPQSAVRLAARNGEVVATVK